LFDVILFYFIYLKEWGVESEHFVYCYTTTIPAHYETRRRPKIDSSSA